MPAKIHPRSLLKLFAASRSPGHPRFFCTHTAPTEPRTQKLERIADELISLTKLERYDYSILFRLKMGLNKYGPAVSGVGSGGPGPGSKHADAGAGAAAAAAEKTVFDIKLEKFDAAAKIKIIKEVRGFTDLGLKEAKDLVEKAPAVLKKGVTKEEAAPILEKLKELGATVDRENRVLPGRFEITLRRGIKFDF